MRNLTERRTQQVGPDLVAGAIDMTNNIMYVANYQSGSVTAFEELSPDLNIEINSDKKKYDALVDDAVHITSRITNSGPTINSGDSGP